MQESSCGAIATATGALDGVVLVGLLDVGGVADTGCTAALVGVVLVVDAGVLEDGEPGRIPPDVVVAGVVLATGVVEDGEPGRIPPLEVVELGVVVAGVPALGVGVLVEATEVGVDASGVDDVELPELDTGRVSSTFSVRGSSPPP